MAWCALAGIALLSHPIFSCLWLGSVDQDMNVNLREPRARQIESLSWPAFMVTLISWILLPGPELSRRAGLINCAACDSLL